jgi:carboxymethylenebutenolidase
MIVFQEAFGVNAHIRDVADRFAQLGFTTIAPELFHRTAEGFEGSYDDFDAVRAHMAALTPEGLAHDARAAYEWLEREAGCDRIAAVGFCLGGRAAFIANAHLPLRAAISFYGGGIAPALLDLAPKQHGPLLMFWGGLDTHIPSTQYRAVAEALAGANKVHEQVLFGQADHGFFCDQRPSYHAQVAPQAWALTQAFLKAYELN